MKVGDLVMVNYEDNDSRHCWNGICIWTDGYKFEFLVNGETDIWTKNDLDFVGAKVISKGK